MANNEAATVEAEDSLENLVFIEEKNGIKFYLGEFNKGEAKGLKYAFPGFSSGAQGDGIYGAAVTGNLLTARVKGAIASKVTVNKLPRNVTPEQAARVISDLVAADPSGKGLIYTVEEAYNFKPGVREPGAKDLMDELQENYATMTPEEIVAKLAAISAIKAKRATTAK